KMNIEIRSNRPEDFKSRITKDAKTDSLNYRYKPRLKDTDSLLSKVCNNKYPEAFTAKISEQPRDTLVIKALTIATSGFEEDFKVSGNIPFEKIAKKRISIKDKDSVDIEFKTKLDSLNNSLILRFDKTESNRYNIQVLPHTFVDFFDNKNDTLNYTL